MPFKLFKYSSDSKQKFVKSLVLITKENSQD